VFVEDMSRDVAAMGDAVGFLRKRKTGRLVPAPVNELSL
jgi:hypothetical protein